MKRIRGLPCHVLFLAGILVLPSCSRMGSVGGYQFDRRGETATRNDKGEIPPGVQHIKVNNQFGDVRIAIAEGPPQWSWELTCWANTQEGAEHFTRQIALQTDQEGGRSSWTLVLPQPPVPELRGVESNLTLSVPSSVHVDVANGFGDTEIRGVQGGATARCKHGQLQLSDLGGDVTAETSFKTLTAERIPGAKLANQHGAIHATEVGGDLDVDCQYGDVSVNGVSGNLRVDNAHGKVTGEKTAKRAEIRTSFAEIQLADVGGEVLLRNEHGSISARRLRGNVDAQGEFGGIDLDVDCAEVVCRNRHGSITLNLTGSNLRRVDAETSFADLSVNVLPSLKPKIQAQTSYGKVRSDLPVLMMETGAGNFEQSDPSVPRITLRNKHGDIRIKKSAEEDADT